MRAVALYAAMMYLVFAQCCERRETRNADCRWVPENPLHAATEYHLSADAEVAEDLAIRYADSHYGLHTTNYVSNDVYVDARHACMQSLFQQIAKQHGVGLERVSGALGHNRGRVDIAVNLPFAVLYVAAVLLVSRSIANKYPAREYGWITTAMIALVFSVVVAVLGCFVAELSAGTLEASRLGNGHLSYRDQRVWPVAHRGVLFTAEIIVFWGLFLGGPGRRRTKPKPSLF
jgi:hypothetical protein